MTFSRSAIIPMMMTVAVLTGIAPATFNSAFALEMGCARYGVSCGTSALVTGACPHPNQIKICADATLTGRIEAGDAAKFESWFRENPFSEKITLRSPGGSVSEALKIGRIIRNNYFRTHTMTGCDSSCAFVALAGASRSLFEIGVHRPTDAAAQYESLSDAKTAYGRIEGEVRKYLVEMDVPQQIVDQVFSTGPDAIRKINLDELDKTVNGPAASVQEWLHKRCDFQLKRRREDKLMDAYEICVGSELIKERAKKVHDETDPGLRAIREMMKQKDDQQRSQQEKK